MVEKFQRFIQAGVPVRSFNARRKTRSRESPLRAEPDRVRSVAELAARFQQAKPTRYAEWLALFPQVHPESFTLQKKFLINDVRWRYPVQLAITN
ncbi:MAG: hypothetical protein LH606_11900 [Cytophagaceae bacterium]|nr:hypothetical protein [Cytophagaceae bacterium]